MGEILLSGVGLMLPVALWCAAVGMAFVPLRQHRRALLVIPGPLVGLLVLLPDPYLIPYFLFILVLTAIVMGPATLLISQDRSKTLKRALGCLGLSGIGVCVARLVPTQHDWLASAMVPIILFGVPVAGVLVGGAVMQKRAWYGAASSALLFALAWAVWTGRAYYYHPGAYR